MASTTLSAGAPAIPLKNWIAVLGTMLGAFMAILDIQITNSSLNDILGSLNATLTEGSWIATAYLIAEIIVIPCSGWLAGVFGPRRVLLVAVSSFMAFSMGCAVAVNLPMMIIFRALQGLAGGFLIPMAFTTMLTMLPPTKRPIGGALFGLTATFAPTIGPTLGGLLTDSLGWPFIFYINVIPGLMLLSAVWYAMPQRPINWQALREGDYGGIAAMAVGLGTLEYCLEEGNRENWFDSDLITVLALIALTSLVVFVWIELTRKQPFINLRLLARRNFGLACLINLTLGVGLYGSVYLLPVYLGMIQHYNATQIGLVIMWVGLPQLFIMPLVPKMMARFDHRWLVAGGLLLFASSCFLNTVMSADTAADQLAVANIIRSIGQALLFVPLTNLATGDIEPAQAGSASGLFNMIRNLGGSMGIALLGTLLTWREHLHSARLTEHVSLYLPATQQRLDQMAQGLMSQGLDSADAQQRAIGLLDMIVRREAYLMAFNDCFLVVGLSLAAGALLLIFMHRPNPAGAIGGTH
jgi:DHA2 family multidrug resistance protein